MNKEEFDKRIDAIIEEIHQLAQEAAPDAQLFTVKWHSFSVPTVLDLDVSIYTSTGANYRFTDAFGVHTWEGDEYVK